MIEPTGPLPSSVYWRRRIAAIAAALVTLVLVIWIVGMFSSDDDTAKPTNAAAASSSNPPPTTSETAPASSSTTPPPSPSETAPPAPPPPPPGPPQPCPDDAIGVIAKANKPFYTIGDQPELSMDVVNNSEVPCIKDIGRVHRELNVLTADGATLLWSSNHCLAAVGSEVRVMAPKEVFNFGTKWAGSTSKPGCGAHTRLGPGDYLVVAKLAGKASQPSVFRLEW